MKYTLMLFDFDGTLANTLDSVVRSYNELAAKYGASPIANADSIRNQSMLAFLKGQKIPLLKLPVLLREFLALQKVSMVGSDLHPGIAEALDAIQQGGCRMGIVSSNDEANIRTCLRANQVEDHFEFIVGYPLLFGKHVAIRRVLKQERIDRRELLYVGDEVRDIEAARKAVVDVAAVTWGFNAPELLAQSRPDYVVDAPAQLPGLLNPQDSFLR